MKARLRIWLLMIVSILCCECSIAQDTTAEKPTKLKKWELHGYIKDLETIDFADGANTILTDNLIHNRINFKWYPIAGLTFDIELRTRLYYGPLVKMQPGFGDSLNNSSNDIYRMSLLMVNKPSLVFQTMLDRAFIDYTNGKWDVKLGRQRINWGINLVWNPNDIFNAYSFYDFDYEEHRGSDAARVIFYPNTTSSIEVAGKIADHVDQIVAAALYKFNKKQYDFQFLGGVANQDLVAGWGWAGHLGGAGFKGEMSYFQPYHRTFDTIGGFSGSISVDNEFAHNIYLNVSFLYNSNGAMHANLLSLTSLSISAKNLYPYRYSFFTELTVPITPLLNTNLAMIYSPAGDNAMFINPGISYSIKENWDIDLISQLFLASFNGGYYKFQGEAIYTRLKWSF